MGYAYLPMSFLPSDFDGYENVLKCMITHIYNYIRTLCRPGEYDLLCPILAVQISALDHVELPENGAVPMTFDIVEVGSYK